MTSTPEHLDDGPDDDVVPTEEPARRQGVKPIKSVDELAQPDLRESDEEYEAFLADLYGSAAPAWRERRRRRQRRRLDDPQGPAIRRPRPATRRSNDSWIAACCIARELPLATLNIKDYADFAEHEGLELVH
jgi:predicted nucleic acid-binding protein